MLICNELFIVIKDYKIVTMNGFCYDICNIGENFCCICNHNFIKPCCGIPLIEICFTII